jgi:tetratricopeptide (TPR) repeat protein
LLAWLSWDLGVASREQARAYVRTALEAARDAGDTALGAYLIGTASVVEHPKDDAAGRLAFLGSKPFGFTIDDATPSTRAWLAGLEAEAYALLGRQTDSLMALERAQTAWSHDMDTTVRPRVNFFDSARLVGEQGICLARLGRAAEAQDVLRAALGALDRDQEKSRPRLLTALGTAHVALGDVDEAVRLAKEALASAVDLAVQPNLHDVLTLREQLEPWNDAAIVKELDEQLAVAQRQ